MNLLHQLIVESIKSVISPGSAFGMKLVLEKNELWITGLDEVITDGLNLNEIVRNSENALTKTGHSDKGTSWERNI